MSPAIAPRVADAAGGRDGPATSVTGTSVIASPRNAAFTTISLANSIPEESSEMAAKLDLLKARRPQWASDTRVP